MPLHGWNSLLTTSDETLRKKILDSSCDISALDINNLSATLLSVAKGGTGAATLTGILKGNGTSAVSVLSDPLPIANGGTGQTTATAAFDALSGMTTAGDIITGGASGTRTRLGLGTANQALKVNSGGTALDYGTLPIVGGGTGQTTATAAFDALSPMSALGDILYGGASGTRTRLGGNITTAKQFLGQTGDGVNSAAPAWTALATGDIPTTLTGKTLTTATIDAASNTMINLINYPQVRKAGSYWGTGSGNTNNCDGMWSVLGTTIAVGTGGGVGIVRATSAAGGTGWQWTTGTTINSLGGLRFNSANQMSERDVNPMIEAKIKVGTITTTRFFFGFTSATVAPTSLADPLNALSGVAFWYDSAVDANLHIMQNSGTGASDATTINVGAMGTGFHTYNIKAVEASTKFQYSYDGAAYADINTKIPAAATGLGVMWYVECLAGSAARTINCNYAWIQQDA